MNPRNTKCSLPAAVFLAALIITSVYDCNGVDAIKLTSLGSTVEGVRDTRSDPAAELGDDSSVEDADYSSLACGAPSDNEEGSTSSSSSLATCSSSYGVDVSFPIHHSASALSTEAKKEFYEHFMEGCRKYYEPDGWKCDSSESERIEMTLRQPKGMYNYTTLGFHKVRAPANVMALLSKFWSKKFTSTDNIKNETWGPGNTYTNHWSAPTRMLSLDSKTRRAVWDATKSTLEGWTGVELSPTSLYGIRVYTEGAVLAPHVDRIPLVISAIVNVAQDVDEPWPLEVYGHDGNAYNITMEVGDIIFYESHSVIHGRPFPLKGRYYAVSLVPGVSACRMSMNIFHFVNLL